MRESNCLNRIIRMPIAAIIAFVLVLPVVQTTYAAAPGSGSLPYAESPDEHFHPKGKPPSCPQLVEDHIVFVLR